MVRRIFHEKLDLRLLNIKKLFFMVRRSVHIRMRCIPEIGVWSWFACVNWLLILWKRCAAVNGICKYDLWLTYEWMQTCELDLTRVDGTSNTTHVNSHLWIGPRPMNGTRLWGVKRSWIWTGPLVLTAPPYINRSYTYKWDSHVNRIFTCAWVLHTDDVKGSAMCEQVHYMWMGFPPVNRSPTCGRDLRVWNGPPSVYRVSLCANGTSTVICTSKCERDMHNWTRPLRVKRASTRERN